MAWRMTSIFLQKIEVYWPSLAYVFGGAPIVFPVPDAPFPPDPSSFFIDAFDKWISRHKGLCPCQDSIEGIAPVEGRGRIDPPIRRRALMNARIFRIRTDGFVRIKLIEDGLSVRKGHVRRIAGSSVLVDLMHWRVSLVNHWEARKGLVPWTR